MSDFKYPHGSVPYSPDTPVWRLKRLACSALNHQPRFPTGSWCFGYGYVCSRCRMYADPWPRETLDAHVRRIREREARGEIVTNNDLRKMVSK